VDPITNWTLTGYARKQTTLDNFFKKTNVESRKIAEQQLPEVIMVEDDSS
jgi:hypothetical protein